MDLSNLKPAKGSVKKRKIIGRGQGSGRGGTSTRGHKGQKSRSGYSRKFGFEGGQQPIQRRLPKIGFKNINRKEYKGINLDTLQSLIENKSIKGVSKGKIEKIDIELLVANGLASKKDLIKILGRGEFKAKIEIEAHAFSISAKAAIEASGGKIIELISDHQEKLKAKRKKAALVKVQAKPIQKPDEKKKRTDKREEVKEPVSKAENVPEKKVKKENKKEVKELESKAEDAPEMGAEKENEEDNTKEMVSVEEDSSDKKAEPKKDKA